MVYDYTVVTVSSPRVLKKHAHRASPQPPPGTTVHATAVSRTPAARWQWHRGARGTHNSHELIQTTFMLSAVFILRILVRMEMRIQNPAHAHRF